MAAKKKKKSRSPQPTSAPTRRAEAAPASASGSAPASGIKRGPLDRWLVGSLGFSETRLWQMRILVSTYIGYAGYYLTRKVFGIAKTSFAKDFHIELSDAAHIWTAFLTAYMVGQFVSSFVGRRWGSRVLLIGGLLISIACNLVFGFTDSYRTFMVFMIFNGLMQATGWPGSVGTVAQWLTPATRGRVMGVWGTNFILGNMLVKSFGGFLLAYTVTIASKSTTFVIHGWRLAYFGCTLIAFAVWWILYFWQRDKPEDVGLPPVVEHESADLKTVASSRAERISLGEYARLALNPVVLTMGTSYFCIKFLRYSLDSWLPSFLNIQGLSESHASFYSQIFDNAGLFGAVFAGWAIDRWAKGNWSLVAFLMSLGLVVGYSLVLAFGANPVMMAICYGWVGFMLYGPDTLLSGAASVQIAGERNGVAVSGIVNGLGSIGPIFQEEVIARLMRDPDPQIGIRNTNRLAFGMSIAFALLMLVVMWRVKQADARDPGSPDAA